MIYDFDSIITKNRDSANTAVIRFTYHIFLCFDFLIWVQLQPRGNIPREMPSCTVHKTWSCNLYISASMTDVSAACSFFALLNCDILRGSLAFCKDDRKQRREGFRSFSSSLLFSTRIRSTSTEYQVDK